MDVSNNTPCSFHHVQVYTKSLQALTYYKSLEKKLNSLANSGRFDPFSGGMRFLEPCALPDRIRQGREIWEKLLQADSTVSNVDPEKYVSHEQDLVEQLIVGLGWRVAAEYVGVNSRSVLVTSMDACGVKLVVSAVDESAKKEGISQEEGEYYHHFDAKKMREFFDCHNGREGVAVLGFELGNQKEGIFGEEIERVFQRYKKFHPRLLVSDKLLEYSDVRTKQQRNGSDSGVVVMQHLGTMKVFEAYAYYEDSETGQVDKGTIIRFVERQGTYASQQGFGNPQGVLPGLVTVEYAFDGTSIPAYSDHWVSNVNNRTSFLKTLNDVLGFTPKVDFNAGVVAAGRAKIESTVTGNDAPLFSEVVSRDGNLPSASMNPAFLRNQTQVYLPINNALSEVGHVHGFLKEVGQGVQHLANRVENLVAFIERANNYRKITGRGFSFLKIPRSYYGHLDVDRDITSLLGGNFEDEKVSKERKQIAGNIFNSLVANKLVNIAGIVDLDVSHEQLTKCIAEHVNEPEVTEKITTAVLKARYFNMYSLLRDNLDERSYLQLVRNQVLVDIQGHDILYQIFTSNVLQANSGDEAPFLEFIQRVCSEKTDADGNVLPIKPGCGGFGIRNFLTLFLSIEVSKAMNELEDAALKGDKSRAEYAQAKVDLFTKQLSESNPVLTDISDAMTQEAETLEAIEKLKVSPNTQNALERLELLSKEMNNKKIAGNMRLQEISSLYSKKFKLLEDEFLKAL